MVTGELKQQVDKVWNAFWTGGIANPLEVIEQITYLLFIKRLDDLHTLAESKANLLGKPIENPVFPEGVDDSGRRPRPFSDLRWSRFKNFSGPEMFDVVDQNVLPFIRNRSDSGCAGALADHFVGRQPRVRARAHVAVVCRAERRDRGAGLRPVRPRIGHGGVVDIHSGHDLYREPA